MKNRMGGILLWAILTGGCASVSGIAARENPAGASIRQLDVVSLLPLHPAADDRLRHGATTFGDILQRRLREARFDTRAVDVAGIVRKHDLPIEVLLRDDGSRRQVDGVLPEKALLAIEDPAKGSHRLVLFPARLASDRRTGVSVGTIHWRLEPSVTGPAVARGVLRYTVDARGFPADRLAGELVAELGRLGVRGSAAALN